ncbi:MAG TPA: aldo/keto reductase [Gammaproteobacteria bacterium]|nr:aldo/keto reductase [Gammaproteobacteria bacterium]
MEKVRLGGTGLKVSRACLGTMTFGLQCDEKTAFEILDRAASGGVDFIDTADGYPLGGDLDTVGATESIIGKWLKGRRHQFVLATKCFTRMGPEPWNKGLSRKHVLDAIDASLARLGTDYVDLYQLHHPDPDTPMEETLAALDHLVRCGKVRYIGISNHPAWQVALALGKSEANDWARFVSVQPRYNLLFREMERELFPLCAEEGLGVIPYNPLAGGLLTGKHDPSAPPGEGTRFAEGKAGQNYRQRYWRDREFATVERLRGIAHQAEMSLTRMAVAWVLANPVVSAPIIGASRPDQLDETLAAFETPLADDVKAELDEITAEYRLGDAPR